jgi:hypothetical protein
MSLHQEETITPQGVHCPEACLLQHTGCHHPWCPKPITAECCTCLPVCHSCQQPLGAHVHQRHTEGALPTHALVWCRPQHWCVLPGHHVCNAFLLCEPQGHGSFGCWVDLPLGSRSADLHSTAVWCRTLLHSSPQPHAVGLSHPSPDGVLATTTKICSRRHFSRGQPQQALQSPMSFYMPMLCSAATVAVDCEANSASLTWAPSIFGAARFGR